MPGIHPPKPRLVLNVGITGHRANALPDTLIAPLSQRIDEVFGALRKAVHKIADDALPFFSSEPALLRLHTPLASGADQMAAKGAQNAGFELRALLPFGTHEYAKDFADADEHSEFRHLLSESDEIFALPGDRERENHSYLMVGKAVIAAGDVLVAVWDGGEGNGPGGTAHVVDLALRAGVPVIHIPVNREEGRICPARLLKGGDAVTPDEVIPLDQEGYNALLEEVLLPETSIERLHLSQYFDEVEKTNNWRFEYPLLLSLLRVKKLPKRPWRQSTLQEDIAWDLGRQPTDGAIEGLTPRDRAYAWANFLAIRYAQMFRSGHVTNYFLSSSAVIVALIGLLTPSIKVFLVMIELAIIALLFYNTSAGKKGDWHRKWLQYRHLAESLRPLAYLKQTGLVGPPFRKEKLTDSFQMQAGADWTRWYAAALWREMRCPIGLMSGDRVAKLASDAINEQISDQATYHRVNSERMRHFDHRLHEAGSFLMGAVIASCMLYLMAYVLAHDLIKAVTYPFIFITAGFPALGAAVFGMRGHGEHLLVASRSAITADALETNARHLEGLTDVEDLAAELEKTGEIMLADLHQWTVSYSERSLEVPA